MTAAAEILLILAGAIAADAPIDFAAQVQPILARHCHACHGSDERKGGLRLTSRADMLLGGDSAEPLFVPGDSAASAILRRITTDDVELRMPPKGERVAPAEVEVIRAWIDQGAAWGADAESKSAPAHWSFQKPAQAPPPAVRNAAWVRTPIDAFVLARLEAAGLAPSPEADRHALIRRLSLDLTGLPPAPAEVEAFVNDSAPNAYERLVERLLASPHYGERMALGWLDAARYADTNGYEKDRERSIWPYRDWVIDAFNRDLSFDRFAIEQIAGDMLPGATEPQRVATGFLRNSLLNEEGGVDVEEFRYKAVVDRTNTISTVFLGLTMECAQCHTHKYDPITQREYFQFYAFLNNSDDVYLPLRDTAIERKRARIEARIRGIEESLESKFPAGEDATPEGSAGPGEERRREHLERRQAAWEAEARSEARRWSVADPLTYTSLNHATFVKLDDGSLLLKGDLPNTDVYEVEYRTDLHGITAMRLEVLPDPSLPGGGPGRGVIMSEGDFLLSEIAVQAGPWTRPEARVPVVLQNASHDFAGQGRGAELTLDGKLDTGWSIVGENGKPHSAVWEFAATVGHDGGTILHVKMDQYYVHQHTIGRFRLLVTTDPPPVRATRLPVEIQEILLIAGDARTAQQAAALRAYYLTVAPELFAFHEEIAALRKQMPQLPTTLVVEEREKPRVTRIQHRGEFLSPRAEVTADVPEVLHALPPHAPRNRLTLARWLADPENPLIARVTVNRLWQHFFGRGLVETGDDFGVQGTPPTHPELLDWLAVEFMRRGWSVKELARLLVTSAVYRQNSRVTPELLAADPDNELLTRGPRFRVEAEVVRDIALTASGLLAPKIGGPSVRPPLAPGLIDIVYSGGGWTESTGPDRYRRGLYTYLKRTLPYPTAITFDAPARDEACVRRVRSNTPLQALTLLNDPVFMEAARAMAERLERDAPAEVQARIQYAFMTLLSRPPDAAETARLTEYFERCRIRLSADTARAERNALLGLAADTDSPATAERAAWVLVCRALLNLDETITKA